MAFHDSQVFTLIDQIAEHYTTNINNRFLRHTYSQLIISREEWDRIDLLVNQNEYDKARGYKFWDLYERIMAMATFISKARNDIAPNLRNLTANGGRGALSRPAGGANEGILQEMAVSNFSANLDVLADKVHELYMRLTTLDKESHKVKPPVYTRVPGLADIGRLLIRR